MFRLNVHVIISLSSYCQQVTMYGKKCLRIYITDFNPRSLFAKQYYSQLRLVCDTAVVFGRFAFKRAHSNKLVRDFQISKHH